MRQDLLAAGQIGRRARACAANPAHVEMMEARIDDPPELIELAEQIGLSPFHFSRAFMAAAGAAPHRYLVNMRMAKARELLETTDLPIAEIASQVGYNDPSYLARIFRREEGLTAASYRRERR